MTESVKLATAPLPLGGAASLHWTSAAIIIGSYSTRPPNCPGTHGHCDSFQGTVLASAQDKKGHVQSKQWQGKRRGEGRERGGGRAFEGEVEREEKEGERREQDDARCQVVSVHGGVEEGDAENLQNIRL
eukprot:767694-Hanusia_phi.AAC.2